ncbi:MAG: hypothetical protein ACKVQW_02255 [Pyrinomonadaceae bacterium]
MEHPPIQQIGLSATDVLALIGAITGIIGTIAGISALVWDFYKWRYSERVRLDVSAVPNFVSTHDSHTKHINVSVTNIGKIPTTIKLLALTGFNSKREMKKRYGEEVSIIMNPAYGTLPVKLNPGDDWFAGFRQDDEEVRKFLKYKHFVIQIEDTMSTERFRAEVDKARILPNS